MHPSHITETSASSRLPPRALCSAQSPVLLLLCDGWCFEFSNHSPDSATTSRRLRRKAASVRHVLAFPITLLSCSLKEHCEIPLWLLILRFSYFPLVWLALSWPETATLTSPHLAPSHLWISPFSPETRMSAAEKGRGGWRREKIEMGIFHVSCCLTWCGWILPTNEQGSSLSQEKNVMGCHVAPPSNIVFVTGEQRSCTDPGWLTAFKQTGCRGTFQEEKCKWP